jgi:hypothetical protein
VNDEPITIVHTIVAPNGPGGINGPPIPIGVYKIVRTRKNASSILATFDPPNATLLDVDFDAMSDDEILALPAAVKD